MIALLAAGNSGITVKELEREKQKSEE